MSAKESWVCTVLLNFVLEEKNEASFKNSSYTDDFIGYLPDIVGERQVTPKKGTRGPALLPETGYTRACNSYVKSNCLLEVGS